MEQLYHINEGESGGRDELGVPGSEAGRALRSNSSPETGSGISTSIPHAPAHGLDIVVKHPRPGLWIAVSHMFRAVGWSDESEENAVADVYTDIEVSIRVHQQEHGSVRRWLGSLRLQNELIAALDEYNALISEELNELIGIAHVHGWTSTRYERGHALRERIAQLRVRDGKGGGTPVASRDGTPEQPGPEGETPSSNRPTTDR